MPPRKQTGGLKPASSGARYTRTHLTGATSQLKHPKPKKGEAAQARLENWNFTCNPLTDEERARNGRVRGRDLVSWNKPRMMEKCMLNFVYECMCNHVKIPWDQIAHRFHPGMSANALRQRFDRLRKELIAEGHLVPPNDITHASLYRGLVRANQNPIDGDLKTTRMVRYEEPFLDADFNLPDSTNFVHNPSTRVRAGRSDAESEPEEEPELPSSGEASDSEEASAGDESHAESEVEQSRENLAAESEEEPSPPPRRKRGRPRGSTKQPRPTIESEDEEPPMSVEKRRRSSRPATTVRKRYTYDIQDSDSDSQTMTKKRSISEAPEDCEGSDGSVRNKREQTPRQPKRSRRDHQDSPMPSGPHGLGCQELPSHSGLQAQAFGSQQAQMGLRPAPGSFCGNQVGSFNVSQSPPSMRMSTSRYPVRSQAPFQYDEHGRMVSTLASDPGPSDRYWGAGEFEELQRREIQRQMIQAAAYSQRLAQHAQGLGLQPLGFGLPPQTFPQSQQSFQQQPQRLAAQFGYSPTRMGRQILKSSAVLESQQQYPASFQRPVTKLEESILAASRSSVSDCGSANTGNHSNQVRAEGLAATTNDTATPVATEESDTIHVAGEDEVRTPVGSPMGPNDWNIEFPPSGTSGHTRTTDSVDNEVQEMLDASAAERIDEEPAADADLDLHKYLNFDPDAQDDVF
ncbi:hypothetical protein DL764_001112 [Monosporascus ibericus]|uniref:Myb-like domain-containing protein n=1 Tax=Monosporascus ibericus TaxID=155417 RepID=A0A4Q4TQS4_9PEZI|nr:hypothetical protein DL764_001112 [Monosporascus ibericus]